MKKPSAETHLLWLLIGIGATTIGILLMSYTDFADGVCIGGPVLLLTISGPFLVFWPVIKQRRDKQIAQERNRQQKETRQKLMNETKKFKVWDPKPWKDSTKTIEKTRAEITGSFNSIDATWNDLPATLQFDYGRKRYPIDISIEEFQDLRAVGDIYAENVPYARIFTISSRSVTLFYYFDDWYITHEDINLVDAVVLIKATNLKNQEKFQRNIERAKLAVEGNAQKYKRERIPNEVRNFVWNRDGGKCVDCGSNEKLEFDHIIPVSKGGSNTARNIQLLCEECNRKKSNKIE